MDAFAGSFGSGIFKSILFATQTFSFESRARARTPIPTWKVHLGRIIHRKAHDRVRRGIGYPDTILGVDDDVEGGHQPRRFYNLAFFDPSIREIKQLIVGAIGNPDIAVRGNADAHQAEEFFLEREVGFRGDRLAIEIHDQDLPVEAADPDAVFRHGGAPADTVNTHAGEAGDRWRKRCPVGTEFDHPATCALVDAGLRAGQPVLAAPEIAVCIEHETPIGVVPATREGQREGEVVWHVSQIRRKGRTSASRIGCRQRIGLVMALSGCQ